MSKPQDVVNFRRRIKTALVQSFGECCQVCGKKYPESVFDFHHLNPSNKSFSLSASNTTHSKADCAKEAKKCVLVCANCHRLIEHENLDISNISSNFDEDKYYEVLNSLANKNKQIVQQRIKASDKKPTREKLKEQIRTMSFLAIGRYYDVSDNAIRKWCKSYNLPSKVSDIKKISDEDWLNI